MMVETNDVLLSTIDLKEKTSNEDLLEKGSDESEIKCSAVHTLERAMPDYDYSHLIKELREKILEDNEKNLGFYSQIDINKAREDDWFLARFLLRQKMNIPKSFEMLSKTLRFRNEFMANTIRAQDFPIEFYSVAGLFGCGQDRKGNKLLYMRVKIHKKMPEIQSVVEAFLLYNINKVDVEANGKGIAIVLDCTDGGLINADMETLMFMISSLINYFPKGLSYILIHNKPWILTPCWQIAKLCIPDEYVQLVKFSNSTTIFEFIDKKELPDFLGGISEVDYRKAPENCPTLKEAAKLWGVGDEIVKKIVFRFTDYLPKEIIDEYSSEKIVRDDDEKKN